MKTLHYSKQRPQSTALIVAAVVLSLTFFASQISFAQVGINNISPNASLDITAANPAAPTETDGLLVPRVSTFPSTNPGAAQNGMLIYLTTTVGINSPGFYYWNNAGSNWVNLQDAGSISDDADLYETGTSAAPAAITDNVYRTGDLALGSDTSGSKLTVTDNTNDTDSGVLIDRASTSVSTYALRVQSDMGGNGGGIYNQVNGDVTSTQNQYGLYNDLNNVGGTGRVAYGVYNSMSSTSNKFMSGVYNSLTGSSDSNLSGFSNFWNIAGNGLRNGIENTFNSAGTGNYNGMYNTFAGTGSGSHYGMYNRFISEATNLKAGIRNDFTRFGVGTNYVDGPLYGVFNFFDGGINSTYSKYGTYTIIPSTVTGTNYGIYADVRGSGSFAAYYLGDVTTLGDVNIGTTTLNTYTLPASRGTNGQVMQTDGLGNLSWQDLSAIVPDDIDFYEIGTTTPPDAISDNIYTNGSLVIGSSTLAGSNSVLEASKTGVAAIRLGSQDNGAVALQLERTGAGQEFSFLSTSSGGLDIFSFGRDLPGFTGGSLDFILDENGDFSLASINAEPENRVSIGQTANSTSTTDKVTIRGMGSTSATNALLVKNQSNRNIAQFKDDGSITIGSTTSVDYTLPTTRGTANQVLQTDGVGNVSWADSNSFWTRSGTHLDVATAGDDISFASDQTSIFFPASAGSPSPMMYMFTSGTSNSDRMLFSQSPAFDNWGLMYRDAGDSFRFLQAGTDRVVINLGAGNPLVVNGNAQATAFVSATTTYPDYVFENYYLGKSSINESYDFPSLQEVETFIKKNGHLPGVKSYAEVADEDMTIDVGATSVANLEKIEELFLYTIELKKENEALKKNQEELEARLAKLEAALLKDD